MVELNRYVLVIPSENTCLLYNTFNGMLIEVLKSELVQPNIVNCSADDEKILKDNLFHCWFDKEDLKQLYFSNQNVMNLTIEVTKQCNLKCSYCYQRDWKTEKNSIISDEIIEDIYILCEKYLKKDVKYMLLSFIGGEPTLEGDKIVEIYRNIRDICEKKCVKLIVHIDTNATIFCELLKEIENLELSVTLSTKEDHNSLRNSNNIIDYYSVIINNILKYEQSIPGLNLVIRYNVHHNNMELLDSFLKQIVLCGVKSRKLDLAYTESHSEFVNQLTKERYYSWLSMKAYEILECNGFDVRYFPEYSFYPCSAYSDKSFKIHCDGKVSLCDSWDINKCSFTIKNMLNNEEEFFAQYSKIKKYCPTDDEECLKCKYLLLCGGKRFCEEKSCLRWKYIEDLLINYNKYHNTY